VPIVGADGEHQEVAEVSLRGRAQPVEDVVGRTHHAEVHVLGGSCPFDTELDGQAALQGHGVAELEGDAREKAVEHHELTTAGEVDAQGRRGA
jgi:hypothetical protein